MIRNIKRCVAMGVGLAVLYSLWVLFVYAMSGPAPFEDIGLSLAAVVSFYFAMGILGGTIVGLLWPLARWRVGAFAISITVALMMALSVLVMLDGNPVDWDPRNWILVPVLTLGFGLAFGNSLWNAASRH
ncbi:MAG TPA: hypothetical protein VIQ74_01520 [Gemmatimonadaceae bacterium]|jgi:hypothetical protein